MRSNPVLASSYGSVAPLACRIDPLLSISDPQTVLQVLKDLIGLEYLKPIEPGKDEICPPYQIQPVSTGHLNLIYLQWEEGLQIINAPPDSIYLMYLVCEGATHIQVDRSLKIDCQSDTVAAICCPGQRLVGTTSARGFALLIGIDRRLIDQGLTDLLGQSPKQAMIFETPIIDLTQELGSSLKQFSQFLWQAATGVVGLSTVVMEELERAFLACLLKGLPHNHSDLLLHQGGHPLASYAQKAQTFMTANLQTDIRLEDVAKVVGVSPRLLEKAFAYYCNCSPMQFLKQARLQRIHEVLCCASPGTKITDVMLSYGFTQGGKFAKAYRKMFGELPSETLKHHHTKPH